MTTTWPALDDSLLRDAAETFQWRLGIPTALAILPDGTVLFRRTGARDFTAVLYELAPDGTVTTLFDPTVMLASDEQLSDAEKARRERSRTATRGVVDIDVSEDGTVVLVAIGAELNLVDRPGPSGRERAPGTLLRPDGEAYDPHLSPDGTAVAFVRDGDLYVIERHGKERKLTSHPPGFEYGVADFAAQEELDRRRGFWWSPDSQSIVFQRSDVRPVDTLYVADARHPEKPPVPFKYPRAGTPNAIVDLGVITVGDAAPAPRWLTWDHATYEYLVSVGWSAHGPLTVQLLNRDQTDVTYLALDPTSGAVTTLLTEHDDAWINCDSGGPLWLDDGTGFLWMTERTGTWTLELRAPDGSLVRPLTTPALGLRNLVGVDATGAIVEASADPTRSQVYRVPFAGGEPHRLSRAEGIALVARAKHGAVVIDTQLATGGREVTVTSERGTFELPLARVAPALVPTTRLETVTLDGRAHQVAITRPRGFDAQRKYPVLLKVYAGPHLQYVQAARDQYVLDQWYADAGFIVVRSDGRGTPDRGRAWERAILRDLITVPLQDQIDALQAVGARHPELDLARVGVTGWSFGGYFSAMAVLLRPDVFKAGVAGAPVTDWSFYDTAYTERYMRTPQANPRGYQATSALTHAAKLSRPLLIVHGITDDNVHFAHSLAFIEALYVAGKYASVITLSATHMVPDPQLALAKEQVQIDFFRKNL